jgi:hypothetical protein
MIRAAIEFTVRFAVIHRFYSYRMAATGPAMTSSIAQ